MIKSTAAWVMKNMPDGLEQSLARWTRFAFSQRRRWLISFNDTERAPIYDLALQLQQRRLILLGLDEALQVFNLTRQTAHLPGDIAELGVSRGGSARLICEAKGDRQLHLFDTFEGLPETKSVDGGFERGMYKAGLAGVKELLAPYTGVHFHQGLFPHTAAGPLATRRFSFVNLDADLYESTLAGFEFFYPRLSQGGIILVHDWVSALGKGVTQAASEYLDGRKYLGLQLTSSHYMVVKLDPDPVITSLLAADEALRAAEGAGQAQRNRMKI